MQDILQQNRMPRLQSRYQKPERWNRRKINIVSYRHKLRGSLRVDFRNRIFIARIDLDHVRILIDDFRLVVSHSVDLVRDLVEICLPDDYPNQFCAAELQAIAFNHLRGPPLIRKWIDRKSTRLNSSHITISYAV